VGLVVGGWCWRAGYSVDPKIVGDIAQMLSARPAILQIYGIQCEWVGPASFAFRAELDFDGHHFARALEREWAPRFLALTPQTVQQTMAAYAEAVTTRVEEEVMTIEHEIRAMHPQASFIELEPRGGLYYKKKFGTSPPSSFASSSSASTSTSTSASSTTATPIVPSRWMPQSVHTVGSNSSSPATPTSSAGDNSYSEGEGEGNGNGDGGNSGGRDSENKFRFWSWKREQAVVPAADANERDRDRSQQQQQTKNHPSS
jgi:hypothetical protein